MVDGTITYDDRYSPGASEVRVTDANFVFEQTLLNWPAAIEGSAAVGTRTDPAQSRRKLHRCNPD